MADTTTPRRRIAGASPVTLLLTGALLACGDAPVPTPDSEPGPAPALPTDAWLVWASNRADGRHEIYLRNAHGGPVARLTHAGGRTPAFSPDGRWISYVRAADHTAHVIRPDGSDDRTLCTGVLITDSPSVFWRRDGRLVCGTSLTPAIPSRDALYVAIDPDTGDSTSVFDQADFPHVADVRFQSAGLTHDGAWFLGWTHGLFDGGYVAENGTFDSFHSTVMLRPDEPTKIFVLGSGCLAATPPSGDLVYHVSRESPTSPDIFRMRTGDVMDRASYELELGFADDDWGHEYMPSISNDNAWMVYAASLACHAWYGCDYDIFLHGLGRPANERLRLVEDPANDNFPTLWIGPLGG